MNKFSSEFYKVENDYTSFRFMCLEYDLLGNISPKVRIYIDKYIVVLKELNTILEQKEVIQRSKIYMDNKITPIIGTQLFKLIRIALQSKNNDKINEACQLFKCEIVRLTNFIENINKNHRYNCIYTRDTVEEILSQYMIFDFDNDTINTYPKSNEELIENNVNFDVFLKRLDNAITFNR